MVKERVIGGIVDEELYNVAVSLIEPRHAESFTRNVAESFTRQSRNQVDCRVPGIPANSIAIKNFRKSGQLLRSEIDITKNEYLECS